MKNATYDLEIKTLLILWSSVLSLWLSLGHCVDDDKTDKDKEQNLITFDNELRTE